MLFVLNRNSRTKFQLRV